MEYLKFLKTFLLILLRFDVVEVLLMLTLTGLLAFCAAMMVIDLFLLNEEPKEAKIELYEIKIPNKPIQKEIYKIQEFETTWHYSREKKTQ